MNSEYNSQKLPVLNKHQKMLVLKKEFLIKPQQTHDYFEQEVQ